jgi:hypothetical protein
MKLIVQKNSFFLTICKLIKFIDGHISIPAIGKTTLIKILNPRFVFTFHQNNIELYKNIQSELGGIGRFENKGENTCRYIVGNIEGIKTD